MNAVLAPIQEAYHTISDDDVADILKDGALRAKESAGRTLSEVRLLMGLD